MSSYFVPDVDYWEGDPQYGDSIAFHRYWWLLNMHNQFGSFRVTFERKTEPEERKDETDIRRFTKWIDFDKVEFDKILSASSINREILPNEIVFELDNSTYSRNLILARDFAKRVLDVEKMPYYAFFSGNKSVHIHAFIEPNISLPKSLAELLFRSNFKLKRLSQAFYDQLLKDYGQVGFDTGTMTSKTHVIRTVGSVNIKSGFFKTYIGDDLSKAPDLPPQISYDIKEYPVFPSEAKSQSLKLRTWKPSPTKLIPMLNELAKSKVNHTFGTQIQLFRFGVSVLGAKRWCSV